MNEAPTEENRAPVFKSWKGWYWLVISVLLAQIIIYTLISNSFK
jgi:hypothetical protein